MMNISAKQKITGNVNNKVKLRGNVAVGGAYVGTVVVDDALSDTSTNPVQNRVVTGEVKGIKEQLQDVGTIIGNIDVLLGTI